MIGEPLRLHVDAKTMSLCKFAVPRATSAYP